MSESTPQMPSPQMAQTNQNVPPAPAAEVATHTAATTTTTTTTTGHDKQSTDVLLYVIAVFLPPLAVYFKCQCHAELWINIGLWFLGWIPGVIHAIYIIQKY
ncbi:hypothetical protein H4582DRAFT_1067436 [Lactarius indigo]|nr:hypothetical protein H4582DRAFT_1067436 [Lactarius indigo]